jgi:GH24 family phage-related lysozyme (muramidase)
MIPSHWLDHFIRFEGKVSHFYLDGEGLVTIGIGCQILDPSPLPMLRKTTALAATRADLFSDYNAVKALPSGRVPAYYDRVCLLVLPEVAIAELFEQRLAGFRVKIHDSLLALEDYPDLAQLVLLDMAFNLGIWGLERKFPKFLNAFKAKDWKTAALECRRHGVQAERNDWTRASLESLITFHL